LLGWESDPAKRNVFGLIEANPELARAGIRLRQFGQQVIEWLGTRKIHAAWAVPGGVRSPLSEDGRTWIRDRLPESFETINTALNLFKGLLDHQLAAEIDIFGEFPTLFMSLVGEDGRWEHYGGKIRFTDSTGAIVADHLSEDDYQTYLGEAVEKWTYLKFPYYKPLGYPAGIYRVGPLARINTCTHFGTPNADAELLEFRDRARAKTSSFLYHYARLVEILAALERIEILMADPDIFSSRVRAQAGVNQLEGIGVSEAPRGTLFHHYRVDENGLIQKVNLIIATGQNNLAMNKTVAQIAKHYIRGSEISEDMLNRVEAGIRCFDPCLSCSTHAAGQMPLRLQIMAADGTLVREVYRD
jgi:NAD-reducing hydrogenase large subunit